MIKRIVSKSEHEKKRKRNSLIVGLILIVVMLGSTFGIVINSLGGDSSGKKVKYGEYEFTNENNFWTTSIGNLEFAFQYLPTQTKNTTSPLKNINNYYSKPLYVSSDDINSGNEIYRNLQQIASRMQRACFSAENCTGDFPIKTCSDNFIIIEEGTEEITQVENCVYIKGEKEKLAELTDSFLYNILGVK